MHVTTTTTVKTDTVYRIVCCFRAVLFSSEFPRIAVIRYDDQVNASSQILLNSYIEDKVGLLTAFDAMFVYNGSNTNGNNQQFSVALKRLISVGFN